MKYNKQIVIRMEEDSLRRLAARAKKEQRTTSQMARVILDKSLRKQK